MVTWEGWKLTNCKTIHTSFSVKTKSLKDISRQNLRHSLCPLPSHDTTTNNNKKSFYTSETEECCTVLFENLKCLLCQIHITNMNRRFKKKKNTVFKSINAWMTQINRQTKVALFSRWSYLRCICLKVCSVALFMLLTVLCSIICFKGIMTDAVGFFSSHGTVVAIFRGLQRLTISPDVWVIQRIDDTDTRHQTPDKVIIILLCLSFGTQHCLIVRGWLKKGLY